MKILHIIPNLKRGGAERMVIDSVKALSANPSNQLKIILFEPKIEYEVADLMPIIEVVQALVRLSVFKSNLCEVDDLQKAIEEFEPDIIHTHLFEAEIISRTCYYPKAKWFSHGHDRMRSFNNLKLSCFGNKRKLTDYFERRYLFQRYKINGGNHFIAISDDIEIFLKDVLPKEIRNIHLLQNAINTKRFENSSSIASKLQGSPFKLISIGRLDENKNHQFLIDCIQDIKALNLDVHLTIIGKGDQRSFLEQKIKKLNLDSNVSLVGSIENVEEYLWQSDVYVHSAITEGFGLTLIEAMAAGLPVVAINANGNRHLIMNGHNGFMVERNQRELFVQHLIDLVKDKAQYTAISCNAINFAQKFDINHYSEELLQLYKNVDSCVE
jgi:glycosyltransferase involved in cell wall biosynthesis